MVVTPLAFRWPYTVAFWFVYTWAFWPEWGILRRSNRSGTVTDAHSLQWILRANGAALALAFPLAWVREGRWPGHPMIALTCGLAVLIAGSFLRRHCWRMLGESFTGDVRARADQEIVTRGAYAVLRHPSYTGGILMHAGIGIALGSWASTALLVAASTAVYVYRMNVEERALSEALGEPYREFMRTRKRIIPFLY